MKPKTKVFIEKFKGSPVIGVWEVDDLGNKASEYPMVSMGIKKVEHMVNHLEELAQFVIDYGFKDQTPAQREELKKRIVDRMIMGV